MARVLVVDDDHTVREVVVVLPARRTSTTSSRRRTARPRCGCYRDDPADLVVLDLMLPGIDGLEVCRRLREDGDVPVIMLTALGEETDRVVGLEIGADDYVTKPFSPRELALRVDSVLRRAASAPAAPRRLVDGDLVVDEAGHAAYRDGEPLALTGREFDLLRFLLAHPGTAFSRDELLQQVWGWSFGDQSTVTVHVRRLREKVEADPTRPVRLADGVGCRLPVGGRDVTSDQVQIVLVASACRGRRRPRRPGRGVAAPAPVDPLAARRWSWWSPSARCWPASSRSRGDVHLRRTTGGW